jgi:hypothetical protein
MTERISETTHDGYLTVIDPARGIGLVCEPRELKRACPCHRGVALWMVSLLLLRTDSPQTQEFTLYLGKN